MYYILWQKQITHQAITEVQISKGTLLEVRIQMLPKVFWAYQVPSSNPIRGREFDGLCSKSATSAGWMVNTLKKINKLKIVLRLKPNPHHKQLFHYMFICCIPICYNIYCSVVTGYKSTLRFPHFSIHQLLSRVSPPTTRESPHVPGPSERARMQNVA